VSTTKPWILTEGEGTKTVWYQVKDRIGNLSIFASDTIYYDSNPPVSTITICTQYGTEAHPGPAYASSTTVLLYMEYPSDVGAVCYSNDMGSWTDWEAPNGTKTWILPSLDGQKRVYAKTKDLAGRTAICADSIILDTTLPEGTVKIDNDATYTNNQYGSVTLYLTYQDATSGVDQVRYATQTLQGTLTYTLWQAPQGIYSYNLGSSTSATYAIYYQIRDRAGNIATVSDTIILDTGSPYVELFTQKPYGSSTQIIIEGTATDGVSPINKVEYTKEGSVWYPAYSKDGSFDSQLEEFTFILYNLPDGTQTITVRAIDQAGNYGTETNLYFHIDSKGPEITGVLIRPPITNQNPILIATATDKFNSVISIDYWIDTFFGTPTATITPINGIGTATIDIADLVEGSHIVYLRAYDSLGNAGDTKQTLFTVITSEAVAIITPGTGTHVKGIVEVSAIAPDSTRKVVFEYGSLTYQTIGIDQSETDGWSVYWKTPQDEASYTIRASAYNISNQFLGSNTVVVEVDNIAPIGTLTITPAIASETATVELIASDDVVSVLFEYGSGTAYDRNPPFSFILDVSNLKEGTWTVFALMEDEVGNKGTTAQSFIVDNTPPSLTIYDLPSDILKGTISIKFSAQDSFGIIGTPTIIIDGVTSAPASFWNGATGTYIWDTTQYSNGGHSLQMKAWDWAGNCGYSPLVQVNVNNTQPPVIIHTPRDMAVVSGTVSVSLSSAPDWTQYVAFSVTKDFTTYYGLSGIGTRTIDYQQENGWRANWLTTAFLDGNWNILACAYSFNHQLIGTDSIRVFVDNTAPKIKILSPTSASPARTYADRRFDIQFSYTEAHPSFLEIELLDGTITLVRKMIGGLIPGETILYESIFVPITVPDGSYTLQLRLGDVVQHQATDTEKYAVIIETTPPDVEKEGTLTFTPNLTDRLEMFYSNALLGGTASDRIARVRIECNCVSQGDITFDKKREFRFILSLREGTNTVDIYFTDISGNTGSLTRTIFYRVPKKVQMIGSRGGVIINPNGSRIEIPEGALIGEKRIAFSLIQTADEEMVGSLDNSIIFLKTYHMLSANSMLLYEFTADGGGYVFHQPVKVTLKYDDSNWDKDLDGVRDSDELDETKLEAFYYDEVERVWIKVGGVVNTVNNTVTFWANHISIFALGVDTKPSQITGFKVYLTRNPFKLGQGTTFVFALPKPGKVTLRIFDLAGDLVREVVAGQHYTGESSVNWNGWNDVSDRYVGSGIYIYQFRVEYDDGKIEQIVKPVGVVK
ncbi:MAG: Ig-like domain-containing protein, partial [bacterium]|nr:Ig-like domain-containing protein [bacterium]